MPRMWEDGENQKSTRAETDILFQSVRNEKLGEEASENKSSGGGEVMEAPKVIYWCPAIREPIGSPTCTEQRTPHIPYILKSDYDALEKEAVEYAEQLIDAVTIGVVLGGVSSPEYAAELEALLIKLDIFLAKHKEPK